MLHHQQLVCALVLSKLYLPDQNPIFTRSHSTAYIWLRADLLLEYQRPYTPDSEPLSPHRESPELISRPHDYHDVEYDDERPHQTQSKQGGYESRVEQLLWESPDPILITHAGKNSESGGGYIVYTIQTGVWKWRLRDRMTMYWYEEGLASEEKIFRIRFTTADAHQSSPNTRRATYPRKAHNGGLCSQTYQSKRGRRYHRPAETHACSLSEPM